MDDLGTTDINSCRTSPGTRDNFYAGRSQGHASLAEPDSHTKSGRESGNTRILSWC